MCVFEFASWEEASPPPPAFEATIPLAQAPACGANCNASDVTRYAELVKPLATCDTNIEEYKKQYHLVVDLGTKHGADHPSIKSSRARMYGDVRANAERKNEILHEMFAINERL